MILFSGTSNLSLAEKVAQQMGIKLGEIEITRFADSECRVYIPEDVEGKEIFVLQSLSQVADQHLVELCLIGQALKNLNVKKITAVIPWLGYSKQDKEFRKGEAISAQLVAKFIEVAGFDAVITLDLHSQNVVSFFKKPLVQLSTHQLLGKALNEQFDIAKMLVAAPDKGSRSRAEMFAQNLKIPVVFLEKERNLANGNVTIKGISADVNNRNIIIFDDIINTGQTAIKASEYLKQKGVKQIYFLATHAVLSLNAAEELERSSINSIIVTDTIKIPRDKRLSKIQLISVAPLLADAISMSLK